MNYVVTTVSEADRLWPHVKDGDKIHLNFGRIEIQEPYYIHLPAGVRNVSLDMSGTQWVRTGAVEQIYPRPKPKTLKKSHPLTNIFKDLA